MFLLQSGYQSRAVTWHLLVSVMIAEKWIEYVNCNVCVSPSAFITFDWQFEGVVGDGGWVGEGDSDEL